MTRSKAMDRSYERQLVVIGCLLASKETLARVEPGDFNAELGEVVKELQEMTAGERERSNAVRLEALLSRLRVPSKEGRVVDSLLETLKCEAKVKEARRVTESLFATLRYSDRAHEQLRAFESLRETLREL